MKKINLKKYTDFIVKETLDLLNIDSPTGYTEEACNWVKNEFESLGFKAHITNKGGVIVDLTGKDKKNGKSYKMYVQKDFGDAIKRGGEPVPIRARMAEVDTGGIEKDRNDLTSQITASGKGMKVNSVTVSGRYIEAMVNVPKDWNEDQASISFTFTGEGGSFTNTVLFRVIDGPSIKFVEEAEEKGSFKTYSNVWGMDMIPGDGFTYTSQFLIMDAMRPPKLQDITSDKVDGFDITFEETTKQYLYKIVVKNNTPPEERKETDVFVKKKEQQLSKNTEEKKEILVQ
jgi:hypothetical protein